MLEAFFQSRFNFRRFHPVIALIQIRVSFRVHPVFDQIYMMLFPWLSSNIYYLVRFPLLNLTCHKSYLCSSLHNHLAVLDRTDSTSASIFSSSSSVQGGFHKKPFLSHFWDFAFPNRDFLTLELAPVGKIAQPLKGNNSFTTQFPSVLVYPLVCTSICVVQNSLKHSSSLVELALVSPEGFLNTQNFTLPV